VASGGHQAIYFGFAALYYAGYVWRRHLAENIAQAGQRGTVSDTSQAGFIVKRSSKLTIAFDLHSKLTLNEYGCQA